MQTRESFEATNVNKENWSKKIDSIIENASGYTNTDDDHPGSNNAIDNNNINNNYNNGDDDKIIIGTAITMIITVIIMIKLKVIRRVMLIIIMKCVLTRWTPGMNTIMTLLKLATMWLLILRDM